MKRAKLILFLSVAGCTGPKDMTPPPAMARIGPRGGTLSMPGIEVTIPAGALSAERDLTLAKRTSGPPAPFTAEAPVFELLPSGLVFMRPVKLVIDYSGPQSRSAVFSTALTGAGHERLPSRTRDGHITATAMHFSAFFASAVPDAPLAVDSHVEVVLPNLAAATVSPLAVDLDRSGAFDELIHIAGDDVNVIDLKSGTATALTLPVGVTGMNNLAFYPATTASDALIAIGGSSKVAVFRIVDDPSPLPRDRVRFAYAYEDPETIAAGTLTFGEVDGAPVLFGLSGAQLRRLPADGAGPPARLASRPMASFEPSDLDLDGTSELVAVHPPNGDGTTDVSLVSGKLLEVVVTERYPADVSKAVARSLDVDQDGFRDAVLRAQTKLIVWHGDGRATLPPTSGLDELPAGPTSTPWLDILGGLLLLEMRAEEDRANVRVKPVVDVEPFGPTFGPELGDERVAALGVDVDLANADANRDGTPDLVYLTRESPPHLVQLSRLPGYEQVAGVRIDVDLGGAGTVIGSTLSCERTAAAPRATGTCGATVKPGTTLTAAPASGLRFVRWEQIINGVRQPAGTSAAMQLAPSPGRQKWSAVFELDLTPTDGGTPPTDGGTTSSDGGAALYEPRRVLAKDDLVNVNGATFKLTSFINPLINDFGQVVFTTRLDNDPATPRKILDGLVVWRPTEGPSPVLLTEHAVDAGIPRTVSAVSSEYGFGHDAKVVVRATLRKSDLTTTQAVMRIDLGVTAAQQKAPQVLLETGNFYAGLRVRTIVKFMTARNGRVCAQVAAEIPMVDGGSAVADGILEVDPVDGSIIAHVEGKPVGGYPVAAKLSGNHALIDCTESGAVYHFGIRAQMPADQLVLDMVLPINPSHWRGGTNIDQLTATGCPLTFSQTNARVEHVVPGPFSLRAMVGNCFPPMSLAPDFTGLWSFDGTFPAETLIARTAGMGGGGTLAPGGGTAEFTAFTAPLVTPRNVVFRGTLSDGKVGVFQAAPGVALTALVRDGDPEPDNPASAYTVMSTQANPPRYTLNALGQVSVYSLLDGAIPHPALWTYDPAGAPKMVAAIGRRVAVAPGVTKTTTVFSFVAGGPAPNVGTAGGMNGLGRMVMGLEFQDVTSGLFLVDTR